MKTVRIIFIVAMLCSITLALLLVWKGDETTCPVWMKNLYITLFVLLAVVFQKEATNAGWLDEEPEID